MPTKQYLLGKIGMALCLCACLIAPASGQEAAADPTDASHKEQPILRTYSIKYAAVKSLLPTIQTVFSDSKKTLRISADERLNALIVLGDAEVHAELADVIKAIDLASNDLPEIRVFRMDDQTVAETAKILDLFKGKVELAAGHGMLITRGDSEAIEQVSQIIELLREAASDKQQTSSPADDVNIEITWLTEEEYPDYPQYTGPIAAMLKQRGFGPVSELGSLQVSTIVGEQAEASGAVFTGRLEAQLTIESGRSNDELKVALELKADLQDQPITFSTVMNVPLNHWVVFGVASSGPGNEQGKKPPRTLFMIRLKPTTKLQLTD